MSGFLKKDDQKASTSTQKEEPLACKESEDLSVAAARSTEEKRSSSMTKLTLTIEQHKADFLALKSVMSYFFYSSALDITDVFKAMFPDSIIAQHMSCGPTKLSYLISFGIAPYFMDLLLKELKDAPCFVISLMSLSMNLKRSGWTFKVCEVKSRYLSSGFRAYNSKRFEKSIWGMYWEVGLEKPHSGIYGWTKHQLKNARLDCRRQELK